MISDTFQIHIEQKGVITYLENALDSHNLGISYKTDSRDT